MKDLSKIKFWLFDLDNTLYDGATKVFDQVDKKMSKFISEKLNVSLEEARKIQKNYFQEYNTTLNGMIKNHKIDADEFLEFVHDVDLSFLDRNKFLEEEIKKLIGKKIRKSDGVVFDEQRMYPEVLDAFSFDGNFCRLVRDSSDAVSGLTISLGTSQFDFVRLALDKK